MSPKLLRPDEVRQMLHDFAAPTPDWTAAEIDAFFDYAMKQVAADRAKAQRARHVERSRETGKRLGYVPTAPLREAFEKSGLSQNRLATLAGYRNAGNFIGRVMKQEKCWHSTAERLGRALGLDPVDLGI